MMDWKSDGRDPTLETRHTCVVTIEVNLKRVGFEDENWIQLA
jgi:hypothetical protein